MYKYLYFQALLFCALFLIILHCGKGKKANEPVVGEPVDILFLSDPPGATVYLDGVVVGTTRDPEQGQAPLRVSDVEWGEHSWRMELEGYATARNDQYIISNSGTKRIDIDLKLSGNLEVTTDPSGVTMYLNGEWQAQPTPIVFENLPAGTYIIRVSLDGYFTQTDTVQILGGAEHFWERRHYVLHELPKVAGIAFRGYHTLTKALSEPMTTFDGALFKGREEATYTAVWVEGLFAEPAPSRFSVSAEVYFNDDLLIGMRREVEVGDMQAPVLFVNQDHKATTWIQPGDYYVKLMMRDLPLAEGGFKVTKP